MRVLSVAARGFRYCRFLAKAGEYTPLTKSGIDGTMKLYRERGRMKWKRPAQKRLYKTVRRAMTILSLNLMKRALSCLGRRSSPCGLYVRMHISPYEQGNIFNRDPVRPRRLLMHKKEILKLYGQLKTQGLTLIPISLYFKGSRVKVQVGLCRGKKRYDKREDLAKRAAKRDVERALKERNR